MKKLLLTPLLLCIAIVGIYSCNMKKNSKDCSQCKVQTRTETISFKISDLTLSTDIWQSPDDKNYRFGQSNIKDYVVLTKVIDYLNIPVENDVTPLSVILYSNEFYTGKNAAFKNVALQGFSYYYYKNSVLRHALFLRQPDNSFKTSVGSLSCPAAGINTGDIHSIVKLFFRNQFENVSALAFTAIDKMREPGEDKYNTLGEQLRKLENRTSAAKGTTQNQQPGGTGKCPFPCDNKYNKDACYQGKIVCYTPTTCPKNEAAIYASINSILPESTINDLFNDDQSYYDLRDIFLANTLIGNKYINYYYALGDTKYITVDIVLKTADVLSLLKPKIGELLNPTTYGSNILIKADLKEKLLALVALYKAKATTEEEITMFNDVTSDINQYAGLTINQFLDAVQ